MTRRAARAFTLLESLVVVSIVALLASLAFPALMAAKHEAKRSRSVSQMRQIHLALMVYCEAQPEEGPLGLGLPPDSATFRRAQKLPRELFLTGGSNWKNPGGAALYTWLPPALHTDVTDIMPLWRAHMEKTGKNPVILLDETFSESTSHFTRRSATGIYFDGHLEHRFRRGSLTEYALWEPPQG